MDGVSPSLPVVDLHCDLLFYLDTVESADAFNRSDIGCAIPRLLEGNVKIQVTAAYSGVFQGSSAYARRQALCFQQLLRNQEELLSAVTDSTEADGILDSSKIGLIFSIENASSFCEEDEPLSLGLERLDKILQATHRVLYISLTHQGENRFGGGDAAEAGLKNDGKVLLDYMSDRGIAVDLSHTSGALAAGILDYMDGKSLQIPVLASHSNFRAVWNHPRNLPDEIAKEVIRRKGIIGLCLMREYLHHENPAKLCDHVEHGLNLGAHEALCFGADFFPTNMHPDKSRIPFFFREHEHAGRYPQILRSLGHILDKNGLRDLAHRNTVGFLNRTFG